jgi:hypothetical protein
VKRVLAGLAVFGVLWLRPDPPLSRGDAFAVATEPIPVSRRAIALSIDGMTVGRGVWIQEADQAHLALRDPLGRPQVVLRIADGAVGMEWVGRQEVVAADAAAVLHDAFASTPSVWAMALWGHLPTTWRAHPDVRVAVGAGYTGVVGPGLTALLDADGRVERAAAAGWIAHRTSDGAAGTDRVVLHHAERRTEATLVLGPAEPIAVALPRHVFRIGSGDRSPVASVEHLAEVAERSVQRVFGPQPRSTSETDL